MAASLSCTPLPRPAPVRVLACGAYFKNRACLIDGDRAWWSAVHGDLGEPEACAALGQSVRQLMAQASGPVQAIAHDLHPDFHSTQLAHELAQQLGVPAMGVQHHHAHIAVALAEHGTAEPVIGLALDGVGLGDDGHAWGGEVLRVESPQAHHWQRLDHLPLLALPGGDIAAREPWRLAASALHALGRGDEIVPRFAPLVGEPLARGVQHLLASGLRCPTTSSAGRWFDAAAGALGLSLRQTHEAQAAMALEACAATWLQAHPNTTVHHGSLEMLPMLAELFSLVGEPAAALIQAHARVQMQARGAALFHLGLASALAHRATELARLNDIRTVVLGGGCFFNRVLTQRISTALEHAKLTVIAPHTAGCGDAALALGQAWVAASAFHGGSRANSVPRSATEPTPTATTPTTATTPSNRHVPCPARLHH